MQCGSGTGVVPQGRKRLLRFVRRFTANSQSGWSGYWPGSVHDRAAGEVDLARGDGASPVGRGEDSDVGDLAVAGQVAD
jgi:hypothetical protein